MIELNADIGEGCDDAALMHYLGRVSIACGGHTGDAASMAAALRLAAEYGVAAGAHPAYPDRAHFGRRALVACIALALIIATLGVYQHASNQYVYLASLFALGFLVFGPQLLIGVAAVGFVPKKAIGAADGIKGTFAYLIGDSFAKLGLGMIADGTPVFGLTGWAGTFAALDAAAVGCICLMAIVAIFEERKIRREKKNRILQTA